MAETPSSEERTQAMLAHLSIILLGIVGPLIFWLIGKDKSAFIDDQGKEALNFSITGTIVGIVTCGLGILVMMVFAVIGGLAANKGEAYRYPFSWRVVK